MEPSIQTPTATGLAALHVAAEAGRDLDDHAQLAALHPPVELLVVGDRRLLDEVARAGMLSA